MTASRRSVLAAAGAGLASLPIAAATRASADAPSPSALLDTIADLIRVSRESNAALMRGDADTYRALIVPSPDFTLMSPFGGPPSRGAAFSKEGMAVLGRFFRNGSFAMEVVEAYGSADMVVLATIERTNVEVGGLPAQDWALRVTLVYRREGSEWRLAHRHADPLVDSISLDYAAALAKGERPRMA